MINNYSLIAPLLNFTEPDDFYMVYCLKRKKDQPEGERDNHQSVRTLKTYCVSSLEYLEKRLPEMMDICEHFKARAYIQINKQNHKDVSLLMLERLAQRIRNGVINQNNLFDSIVGELHSTEKRFIVDIDEPEGFLTLAVVDAIIDCKPLGECKVLATIPTKNGVHLITKRFDVVEFKKHFPHIEVIKHNPTLLFLPNSLE